MDTLIKPTPTLWLIAGPNGVGKTTYAFRHIRQVAGSVQFVNLDEIARGLSPLDPAAQRIRAARTAIAMARDLIGERASFSIETTLAGRGHRATVALARAAGMRIALLYFAVARVETCLARIARRVAEGGHDVPEADARRRFVRSTEAVRAYVDLVDLWRIFDANGPAPKVVAEGRRGCAAMIGDIAGLPARLSGTIRSLPPCPE